MDDPNAREDPSGWETEAEEGWIFELPKGAWERQESKNRELRDRLLRNLDRAKDDHRSQRPDAPAAASRHPAEPQQPTNTGDDAAVAPPPPLVVRRHRERAGPSWDDVFSSGPAGESNPTTPADLTVRPPRQEPPRSSPRERTAPERPAPELPPIARRRDRTTHGGPKWDEMMEPNDDRGSIVDAMREWVERSRERNQASRETPKAAPEPQPAPGPEGPRSSRLGARWTLGPKNSVTEEPTTRASQIDDDGWVPAGPPPVSPQTPADTLVPGGNVLPAGPEPGSRAPVPQELTPRPPRARNLGFEAASRERFGMPADDEADDDWRPAEAPAHLPPTPWSESDTVGGSARGAAHLEPYGDAGGFRDGDGPGEPLESWSSRLTADDPPWSPGSLRPAGSSESAATLPVPGPATDPGDEPPPWDPGSWRPSRAPEPAAALPAPDPATDPGDEPPPWNPGSWRPSRASEPAAALPVADPATDPRDEPPAWDPGSWRPSRAAEPAPALPGAPGLGTDPGDEPPAWDPGSWRPSRAAEPAPALPGAPGLDTDPGDEPPAWDPGSWRPSRPSEAVATDPADLPSAREAAPSLGATARPDDETQGWESDDDWVEGDDAREGDGEQPATAPAPTLPDEFDWRNEPDEESVLVRAFNAKAASAAARETSFVELLGEGGDELVAEVADPATSRFTTAPENWGQSYLPPVTQSDDAASIYRVPMAPDEPAPAPVPAEFVRPAPRGRGMVRGLVETALLALLVFLGVRASFQNFRVDGSSMFPTLENSEFLLVNKLVYSEVDMGKLGKFVPFIDAEEGEERFVFHGPHRGDIIVLRDPRRPEQDLIKRVVGLPGETVEIRNGQVFINDYRLDEPYIIAPWSDTRPKITVPEGQYYVLGDNRNNSLDSRSTQVGLIPKSLIVGKAVLTYWPLDKFGLAPNAPGTTGGPELTTVHISEAGGPRTAAATGR